MQNRTRRTINFHNSIQTPGGWELFCKFLPAIFVVSLCVGQLARAQFEPAGELHRIHIQNLKGGKIQGSKDGGKTWVHLGKVVAPVNGGVWLPAVDNGVTAFNYLRGPSGIFASAINNIHIRFSDPKGYTLPTNPKIQPIEARGISISPRESGTKPSLDSKGRSRSILTNIPGGTSIFSGEWSPRIGSEVVMGKGKSFSSIPYNVGPDSRITSRSELIIITYRAKSEIEYIQFQNMNDGLVSVKRAGEAPVDVARVLKPVKGVGRFIGSGFLKKPGQIRANHAGVIDIGTTDVNTDPALLKSDPLAPTKLEYFGGIQIVPSFHWNDKAMENAHKSDWVYAVLEPLQSPPTMDRYDQGLEGSYPLFKDGVRAGTGTTYFKFQNDTAWYELSEAQKLGKFKREDGSVVKHLRGHIKDALHLVTDVKVVF